MPLFFRVPFGEPLHDMEVKDPPRAPREPYLHIGLGILVTFQEKVFQTYTFLVMPEMEACFVLGLRAPYLAGGVFLFDAFDYAKDETSG